MGDVIPTLITTFGYLIFSLIGLLLGLAFLAVIVIIVIFAIKSYMKKYNAIEESSEKAAAARHKAAEENLKQAAQKHEENLAAVEEKILTESVKCSYCGKFSSHRIGSDFVCPYCGANAPDRNIVH